MKTTLNTVAAAAALIAFAGAPLAIAQQNTSRDRDRTQERDTNRQDRTNNWDQNNWDQNQKNANFELMLKRSSELTGTAVHNRNGDKVGDIGDMIISRETGLIDSVVMNTGTILGMGGKEIRVPFNSMNWNASKERIDTTMTKAQIDAAPEFNRERAGDLPLDNLREQLAHEHGDRPDMNRPGDRGIDRNAPDRQRDDMQRQRDDTERNKDQIERNRDQIERNRDQIERNRDQQDRTNRDSNRDQQDRTNRDPNRDQQDRANRDPNRMQTPAGGPYGADRGILLSTIVGQDLDCITQSCGDIKDTLVELSTGRVLYLVIDPDENFLGISDTLRIAPFTVASWNGDASEMRIQATRQQVLASPEFDDDAKPFADRARVKQVYSAFSAQAPKLDRRASDYSKDTMHDSKNTMRDSDRRSNENRDNRDTTDRRTNNPY